MFNWFKQHTCKHNWKEWYSGMYADEQGGPRTVHYIHWTCENCGKHMGDEPDMKEYAPGEVKA